jgi:hypothetical protein
MKKTNAFIRLAALVATISLMVPAQAAYSLPSSFEKERKRATLTSIGKPTALAVEVCRWSTKRGMPIVKCKLQKLVVTVNGFKFKELRDSIGFDEHTYEIDVTLENYSSQRSGLAVGSLLRCSNSRADSSFYAEGLDPQYVMSKTRETGVIVASFPSDVTAINCQNPTLWLSISSGGVSLDSKKKLKTLKKKKLSAAAYIPLSEEQLSR